jgi:hypothetical protein
MNGIQRGCVTCYMDENHGPAQFFAERQATDGVFGRDRFGNCLKHGLRSDPFGASTVVLSFGERQGGTESKADIFARNYFGSMTLSPRI